MSRHFIVTIIMATIIFGAFGIAVLLAKGYTFSPDQKTIIGTGIISIKSEPDSASVYIDDHLTTATNATISSLPPRDYKVRVIKEGFIPWEKLVSVKEGLVSELEVRLFPAIPTIYPLTFNGVKNPALSPDGSKLAFVVPSGRRAGIWVWTMVKNQPIAFARSAEPHQIGQTNNLIDYSNATFKWSPDSKEVIATIGNNNYLLDSERLNTEPRDITPTLQSTLKGWEEDTRVKDQARIEAINNLKFRKIASEAAVLKWSPDETKFIYISKLPQNATPSAKPLPVGKVSKEGTNSAIAKTSEKVPGNIITDAKVVDLETGQEYLLPPAREHFWLPETPHIGLVQEGKVSVVDYDGTNEAIIYAGNFLEDFVFPWPDSSRIVLISTFPTPTASEPNLYGINLK